MNIEKSGEIDIEGWIRGLMDVHARIASYFERAEPCQHVLAYLKGLLGPVERKNGWQIAEWVGDLTPDGIQRLLSTAKWDADLVCDDLQGYVKEHLADLQAVLIVDETGFPKQGCKSVGGQRQYCGRTGRVEIVRWACLLPMPVQRVRPFWIENSIFLRAGSRMTSGVGKPEFPT